MRFICAILLIQLLAWDEFILNNVVYFCFEFLEIVWMKENGEKNQKDRYYIEKNVPYFKVTVVECSSLSDVTKVASSPTSSNFSYHLSNKPTIFSSTFFLLLMLKICVAIHTLVACTQLHFISDFNIANSTVIINILYD